MVSEFTKRDIKKVFEKDKKIRITLMGKEWNTVLAGLELPIIPSTDVMDLVTDVAEKIKSQNKKVFK